MESASYIVTVKDVPTLDNGGDLLDSTGSTLLSKEVCEGGTPETLSVEVISDPSSTGVFSYQWYSNTTNSNTGGIEIDGANSASYTPVSSPVGVTFYYAVVSQEGSGCVVASNTSSVTVTALPIIDIQPTPLTEVCVDGAVELSVVVADGVGTPEYQWFENTTATTIG